MAWDATQPTDSTKIRNLGVVIRPNWVAIEQADTTFRPQAMNFKDRTVAGVSVNPTALADAFITYCKTDTAGNSELFGIDEDSHVIQYSYGGRMGGPLTPITFTTINFGTSTTTYTKNNFNLAYGRFTSNGSTVVANNCSITRIGTGQYRVILNPVPVNSNYVPVATAFDEGNARICKIAIDSTSQFRIRIINEDGDNRDCGGYFQVCGGD